MWSAVPYDVLINLIEIAPLQTLPTIRLLEKRCATVEVAERRLACAHHLLTSSYKCTGFAAAVRSGARLPQLKELLLNHNQIGEAVEDVG